jgi:hypothetical protein
MMHDRADAIDADLSILGFAMPSRQRSLSTSSTMTVFAATRAG